MALSTIVLKLVYTVAVLGAAVFWIRTALRLVVKAADQPARWILYLVLGWVTVAIVAGSLYLVAQTWGLGG